MATLYVLQGPDKGRTLKTTDAVVLVGRGSDQMPLTDQTISRRHAQLRRADDAWLLEDLNSANGTYVNGVRIRESMRLKHGDQIRLGGTLLVYAGDESVEQFSGSKIPRDLVTLDAGSSADASIVASIPSSEDSVILAAPETAYAVKAWKVIRQLIDVIGSLITPEQLLARVMDIVFEEVKVDRGMIFLHDEATREMLPEVVRFHSRKLRTQAQRSAVSASRTIMNHVVESRGGVLCADAGSDQRFVSGKSVQSLGMRSVICTPIMAREQVLGVIYLECPVTRHTYNEDELRLITAIGYQTGLAIENARLVQSHLERERLAAAGETIAYLSHSIKNLLQGMRSGADVVQRGLNRRDFAQTTQGWRMVDRNLDRCFTLMLNMLAFSTEREPQLELLQVNKIVDDVVELVQKQADDARVVLLSDVDETVPPIPVDYDGLHQVLLNLVLNAIDAVSTGSGVINVRTRFDAIERHVIVSVADNGPGVPEEQRDAVFEPFHSTKGHHGTGLGLAVVRKIAGEMGCSVELHAPPEGGTEFVVRLPTAEVRPPGPGDTQAPTG